MSGAALLLLAGLALAPLTQGEQLAPPWRVVGLPQQQAPLTRYRMERLDGRDAVRVQADASYGNLVHELPGSPAPHSLSWSWRLAQPLAAADLRSKAGDDTAIKVCMSFDLPLDRVPFFERQLLRLARARSGQVLPAATLCWVWAVGEAPGTVLTNAYTARVRYLVLRDRHAPLQQWLDESRDVAADYRLAFGDESAELPPVSAVIVAGDADNTGGHALAHVAGLRVAP